ncbi:SHOCT domain-containing protein [Vibrio cholerae]|nr:SHOCT domain-containing protein [Vibrio cholerae]
MASVADELDKLHSLKERGVISEDEFNAKKKELIQL